MNKYLIKILIACFSFTTIFCASSVFAQFQAPCFKASCPSPDELQRNTGIWAIIFFIFVLLIFFIFVLGRHFYLKRKQSEIDLNFEKSKLYKKIYKKTFSLIFLILFPAILTGILIFLSNFPSNIEENPEKSLRDLLLLDRYYYITVILWFLMYYGLRFVKRLRFSKFFKKLVYISALFAVVALFINLISLFFLALSFMKFNDTIMPLLYFLGILFFCFIFAIKLFYFYREKDTQDELIREHIDDINRKKVVFPTIATFAILGLFINFYIIWSTNSIGRFFYSANMCSLADASRHIVSEKTGNYGPICYTKKAKEKKNQSICESLFSMVAEKRIDVSDYTRCLNESGDIYNNISFCNKFEDKMDAKRCIGTLNSLLTPRTAICEKLSNPFSRDYCKHVFIKEGKNKDPLYCRNIQDENIRDYCFFAVVAQQYSNDNLEICNEIQDGHKKDECKLGVITHGDNSKELCNTIYDADIRQNCITYGDPGIVIAINSIEECASTSSAEDQIKCMNNFTVNKKDKSFTIHNCMKFPKLSETQDYCMHLIDANQKKVSFCVNFLSDRFRKECESGQLNW